MKENKKYGLFDPADLSWIHGIYLTLEECKKCIPLIYRADEYVIAEHTKNCLKDNEVANSFNCCIGIKIDKATKEEVEYLIKALEL